MIIGLLAAVTLQLTPVEAIRDHLDGQLIDYTRARFREVRAWRRTAPNGNDITFICGSVNAPNVSGGMTGWQEFAFSSAWSPTSNGWAIEPNFTLMPLQRSGRTEAQMVDDVLASATVTSQCRPGAEDGERLTVDISFQIAP